MDKQDKDRRKQCEKAQRKEREYSVPKGLTLRAKEGREMCPRTDWSPKQSTLNYATLRSLESARPLWWNGEHQNLGKQMF